MSDEQTEVIISEIEPGEGDGNRTLRVYDPGGDFLIEVPVTAKVTFGYFNPAAASDRQDYNQFGGRGGHTMKTTALRVYEKAEKGNQLACFLGVTGFRDMSVKLTRLRQRVTIESNFEDDGLGNTKANEAKTRALMAAVEDEVAF